MGTCSVFFGGLPDGGGDSATTWIQAGEMVLEGAPDGSNRSDTTLQSLPNSS